MRRIAKRVLEQLREHASGLLEVVVDRGHLIRSFAIDNNGTFYIAINRRTAVLASAIGLSFAIMLIVLSVLAISTAGGAGAQARKANRAVAEASAAVAIAREAQAGSCERVNFLRGQSNRTDAVGFLAYINGYLRERRLAEVGPNSATHARSAQRFLSLASQLTYTEPTDCERANSDPGRYEPPRPQQFTLRIAMRKLLPRLPDIRAPR